MPEVLVSPPSSPPAEPAARVRPSWPCASSAVDVVVDDDDDDEDDDDVDDDGDDGVEVDGSAIPAMGRECRPEVGGSNGPPTSSRVQSRAQALGNIKISGYLQSAQTREL